MEGKPKILIVDDEPLNLDYLEQELEDRPVEIITAANGQSALEAVAAQLPEMIFLDIMMPVMDGFEVLRRLKANLQWKDIPVVIISAATDMASVVKGIELGAEDFLPKPFNPVILHARLNSGLEKKRLRDIEKSYLRSLERELEIGREIQAGFLPKTIPQPSGWEIEACFHPAREVAGDFYDVFELDDAHLVLLLGDVTDKGVGAALFMSLYSSLLRVLITMDLPAYSVAAFSPLSPETRIRQAVNQVNHYITSVHESSMLATLFVGVLDHTSGELCYINAGHDHPYLLRSGSIHAQLTPTSPLVGAIEDLDYTARGITLQPGDRLVIYSDGITDALDPEGQMYSKERWQDLLCQPVLLDNLHAEYLAEKVLEFAAGAPQYDDISLLVLTRK
ncbi:MAG: hypothetical protein A2Z16_07415 [Chloroflexi bacterium RBG_16_54_18]|nr:MAG: hypothetical protein A2Z16_07415 [Chloroflexi bacterium RBG_16_54_18]